MKKTVKSLIIAASVAAVAGIGAVSFAAWSGGSVTDLTQNGATGEIVTDAGTLTATQNLSDTIKLVPYDQTAQFDSATMTKMQTINLTYTAGDGLAVDKMALSMTLSTAPTLASGSKLMYKLGEVAATPTTDLTGWTELTTDEVELSSAATQKINIILVSGDTADMNASYVLTFSAAEKTA